MRLIRKIVGTTFHLVVVASQSATDIKKKTNMLYNKAPGSCLLASETYLFL